MRIEDLEELKIENLGESIAKLKDQVYTYLNDNAKLDTAYQTLLESFKEIKDQEVYTLLLTLHTNYKDDAKDGKDATIKAIDKILDLYLDSGTKISSRINAMERAIIKLESSNSQNTWLSKYIMPGLIILMFIWSIYRVDPDATKFSTNFTKDFVIDTRSENMSETEREAKLNSGIVSDSSKSYPYGDKSYGKNNPYYDYYKSPGYNQSYNKSMIDNDWGDVK